MRLCPLNESQCCSQANEDALGRSLNYAIRDNVTLGVELESTLSTVMTLYSSLDGESVHFMYRLNRVTAHEN